MGCRVERDRLLQKERMIEGEVVSECEKEGKEGGRKGEGS